MSRFRISLNKPWGDVKWVGFVEIPKLKRLPSQQPFFVKPNHERTHLCDMLILNISFPAVPLQVPPPLYCRPSRQTASTPVPSHARDPSARMRRYPG